MRSVLPHQPSTCAICDDARHPLTPFTAPAQPPVEHGGIYGLKNWPPEKFVKVDWIGDDGFAGRVFFAEPGQSAASAMGCTMEPLRKTFGMDSNWRVWSPTAKPAPVEPAKPVVKKWEVTTETRVPKAREFLVDPDANDATSLFIRTVGGGLRSDVVTAVKPLEPPRVKTVRRAPMKGEQYILTAGCDWSAGTVQVLVVE